MTMRIRLHTNFFQNHLYERGDIVDLPDGVEGPHGSQQVSHDRIDYDPANGLDANRLLGKVKRLPLFDVIGEDDMLVNRPALPTTLADRPVAERRGDDLLDRGAHHVAHPADFEVAKAHVAAEPETAKVDAEPETTKTDAGPESAENDDAAVIDALALLGIV
jgi:hypothetical protein